MSSHVNDSEPSMNSKLGRNDQCWCGSGKKYKYCHLSRDHEEPVTHQEIIQALRKAYGKKYCLHPKASAHACQGKIIRAHTIQKRGGLERIAREGRVYWFPPDYSMLVHNVGNIDARLIGIREASTFTGFCNYHDTTTFAPIEMAPFEPTLEQIFLLGYRSICRELFAKREQMTLAPLVRNLDRGKGFSDQKFVQNFADLHYQGVKFGLENLEAYKKRYDMNLVSKNFADIRYYVVRLKDVPEIMCSGSAYFEMDFQGNLLQDIGQLDEHMDGFSFSLIGEEDSGMIVFSWLGNSLVGTNFARTLNSLADNEIPHAVVRLIFAFFENTFFSPFWWESLSDTARESIKTRINVATSPVLDRKTNCLMDDGLRVVNWQVTERLTNVQS